MWMTSLYTGIWPITMKVLRQETYGWVMETLSTMAIPLSFFLAFGLGLRGYIQDVEGSSYLAFLTPGIISMTLLSESFRCGGWGTWLDQWFHRTINEYRIKPVPTLSILIGMIIGDFVVAVAKGLIVALVIYCLAPFHIPLTNLIPYLAFILPGCILFASIGIFSGVSFRKADQIAQVQLIFITPLLYLGGMFFPISVLPQWIQPVITWLPTTAFFHAGRLAFMHGELDWFYLALAWGYALIALFISAMQFNYKLSR